MKEGQIKTHKEQCMRRACDECGEPASLRISYLLENARNNPASSGYGGDDISWCSDAEAFACYKCQRKVEHERAPDGMEWGSTFTAYEKSGEPSRFSHMLLYWEELKGDPK